MAPFFPSLPGSARAAPTLRDLRGHTNTVPPKSPESTAANRHDTSIAVAVAQRSAYLLVRNKSGSWTSSRAPNTREDEREGKGRRGVPILRNRECLVKHGGSGGGAWRLRLRRGGDEAPPGRDGSFYGGTTRMQFVLYFNCRRPIVVLPSPRMGLASSSLPVPPRRRQAGPPVRSYILLSTDTSRARATPFE